MVTAERYPRRTGGQIESYRKFSISMPGETHQRLMAMIDRDRGESISGFITSLVDEFYERMVGENEQRTT